MREVPPDGTRSTAYSALHFLPAEVSYFLEECKSESVAPLLNYWSIYPARKDSTLCLHCFAGLCMADSAEVSRAKVTVETPLGSVKMRTLAQVPVIGPEDDLTGVLLQVNTTDYIAESHTDPYQYRQKQLHAKV